MSVVPELERIQFSQSYNYVFLPSNPGVPVQVWYTKIDGNFVGFIERIAFDWFLGTSNTTATASLIQLNIDGFIRSYQYSIDINKPYVFEPPLVARNFISWTITNNDVPGLNSQGKQVDGGHFYGILCDGFLAKPKSRLS